MNLVKTRKLNLPERSEKMVAEEETFLPFLQQELVRRCQSNPRYSLRAFAKYLDVDPSFLSKLFNGKRSATPEVIRSFSRRLDVGPDKEEQFLKLNTESEHLASKSYNQLTLDYFRLIADWHHYAILELIQIDGFESSEKWISRSLGISTVEAKTAVERLVRLELIEIKEDGVWVNRSGSNTTVGNEFTDAAFRKLQKSVLEKAIIALEEIPFEFRDQTSMTLATDPALIPEAKKRIKQFRRSLTAFLESTPKKKAVYHLGLSLYPISKIEIKNNEKRDSKNEK